VSTPNDNRWKRRFGPLYHLLVAVQFLTRLPVPRDLNPELEDLGDSVVWFPVVGTLVGGLLGGLAWVLLRTPLVPAVDAGWVVVAGVVVTGAFHEDALGDAVDGLVGGWRREEILQIMRDSRVGTYASVALASLLGLRALSLIGMNTGEWVAALVVAHTLGRATTGAMLAALPYARSEDEDPGVGRLLGAVQSVWRAAASYGAALCVAVVLGGWTGFAAAGTAIPVCLATGAFYYRRVGGVTGDCLGATNVLVELSALVLFAGAHPAMTSPWIAG